jgi:hypothetical protein
MLWMQSRVPTLNCKTERKEIWFFLMCLLLSPDQGAITMKGTPYLREKFPKLDFIKTAVIKKD